jgi:hypothetical protein
MTSVRTAIGLLLLAAACGGGIVSVSPGRPPFHPGSREAYWIWHDEAAWHLRTTTASRMHRFHGWIEPIDGQVTEIRPTRLDWGDRIHKRPRGIEFDFSTDGSEDGFDWRVSSGCNRFFLEVDGVPRPELTHLGGADTSPVEMPFRRCPP